MTYEEYFMIYDKSFIKEIIKNIIVYPFWRIKEWKKRNKSF